MTLDPSKSIREDMIRALAALGIVFGDIGTSILYTFQECLHGHHPVGVTEDNILGLTSLILWALILVVTVKYVLIMMRAENKGEGGILTLLSLVPLPFRFNERGKLALASLLAVAGAALLYGDGIITPAISVLSAMEGLELADPAYEKFVMPGTVIILSALFWIQSRGTGKIGRYFGIIVLVWFTVSALLGLKHLWGNWHVLRAFYPKYAVHFFAHEGFSGIRVLGSVILAVTGGEALYADMGHFGRRPIRLAWFGLVLPALMMNYLGQAAMMIRDPETAARPFYSMLGLTEGPLFFALVILATLATIIASQAMITGAYSLTHQAIRLGIFPRIKVVHTSEELEGRVYLPSLNLFLAVSCLTVVLAFQKSTNLASAYGLAVSGTMLFTSLVFFYVMTFRWKLSRWISVPVTTALVILDSSFLYANALKIPDGGYLPLAIGIFFFAAMVVWQYGRAQLSRFFRERSKTLDDFFEQIETRQIRRITGTLVVLASNENKVPPVLGRLVDSVHVIHEHILLVTVMTVDDPFVPEAERVQTEELGHGFTRVLIHYGFMETPDVPAVLARSTFTHLKSFPVNDAIYLIGRETFIVNAENIAQWLRQHAFSFMSRNASSASNYFNLPSHQVLELGAQLSI